MNTPGYNDPEFDQVITGGYTDPHPYGTPTPAVKTGLTPRGKAALGVGTAVIACGTLFGWQQYTAQQANADVKAQEIALKQQQIELEKLKEMNKANTAAKKSEAAENSERNKLVDDCVDSNKKMVGKLMGVTYQSVRSDCETQYPAVTSTDMQTAATTTDSPSDGGPSTGLLIGVGAIALGVTAVALKSKKPTPA
ncbi:hypothetical protein [Streptomyces sp. PU_AKi4]|uniref:hypothetical protein n=1 Tax=Streptomyces sp. PU_AKi4 TaxID=2800809 RepID=UPI0035267B53